MLWRKFCDFVKNVISYECDKDLGNSCKGQQKSNRKTESEEVSYHENI